MRENSLNEIKKSLTQTEWKVFEMYLQGISIYEASKKCGIVENKKRENLIKRIEIKVNKIQKSYGKEKKMKFTEFYGLVKESIHTNLDEIDKWFDKPKELREYIPEDNGWTINLILEHVSLTNFFLLKLIDKAKSKSIKKIEHIDIENFRYEESDFEKFEDIGKSRSFSWTRPEHHEPKGLEPLDVIRERIRNQKKECLKVLEVLKNGEGLSVKTGMSVNGIGKIDVYQYIYFLSLHAKRHIGQMERNEKEYVDK